MQHKDNWASLDRVLAELQSINEFLKHQGKDPSSIRVCVRVAFSGLETIAFVLKRIVLEAANTHSVQLAKREIEVLRELSEPSFPGLPPPRRLEAPLRESLTVALNVYARVMGSEPILSEGRLPPEFIDASRFYDRILHPDTPGELDVNENDTRSFVTLLVWLVKVKQWLTTQRETELEDLKRNIAADCEALQRKIRGKV